MQDCEKGDVVVGHSDRSDRRDRSDRPSPPALHAIKQHWTVWTRWTSRRSAIHDKDKAARITSVPRPPHPWLRSSSVSSHRRLSAAAGPALPLVVVVVLVLLLLTLGACPVTGHRSSSNLCRHASSSISCGGPASSSPSSSSSSLFSSQSLPPHSSFYHIVYSYILLLPIMVAHLGSWAARALSLLLSPRADAAFALKAATATDVLQQQWYNTTTGLWDSTGWWNAANALTVLGDYAYRGGATGDHRADIVATMANTFVQAQQVSNAVSKTVDAGGLVHSFYLDLPTVDRRRGFHGFINDYYDDEGWWALAWIRAYDVTRHAPYLDMAISIVDDMAGGGGTPSNNTSCGGGIWWSKSQTYKNAIANELYLAALALLANRAPTPEQKQDYAARAVDQWQWFRASGMINNASLINDGLTIHSDGTCTNNGGAVWSYNQGVVLGGLVELFVATGDASLLVSALAIAHAAIAHLAVDGILHEESCDRDGNSSCGGDGATFKGVFLRNLGYLCEVELIDADTRGALKDFIRQNANSIWDHDRNAAGQFGLSWSGPVADAGAGAQAPTAATHASAMDCLVAAASFL